jgi:hypothetical protein
MSAFRPEPLTASDPDPSIPSLKRALLVLSLCLAGLSAWPLAAQAGAPSRVLDSYCSPSGDYCTAIKRSAKGQIVLSLRTFAFTDKYKLCVEAPVRDQPRECGYWWLKDRGNGVYASNVLMREHFFFKGAGQYRITWWYGDGNRLGRPLSFEN